MPGKGLPSALLGEVFAVLVQAEGDRQLRGRQP